MALGGRVDGGGSRDMLVLGWFPLWVGTFKIIFFVLWF